MCKAVRFRDSSYLYKMNCEVSSSDRQSFLKEMYWYLSFEACMNLSRSGMQEELRKWEEDSFTSYYHNLVLATAA